VNETRCRACQTQHGPNCLICSQSECSNSTEGDTFILDGQVLGCSAIENCALNSCSATGCTTCNEGYFLNAETGTCDLCSDAIPYCSTCSSSTQCTACSHESFIVSDTGTCICDNTGKEDTMIRDEETGFCSCSDGLFMDLNHGCLACDYMIPGCRSCS